MVKLNLASGQMYLQGYVNIDNKSMYHGKMEVDEEADIFTLQKENNSIDEILLSHFAMFVSPDDMRMLVSRWHGWLKKGGQLIIENPDIRKIATHLCASFTDATINNHLKALYNYETAPPHKWAWCSENLAPLMEQAGFKNITSEDGHLHGRPFRDFRLTGTK